jgi:hypothetical protein
VVAVEAGVSRRAAKLSVVFGEVARALHTTAKMCDRWTREDTADTAQLGDGGDKGKIAASNARRIGGGMRRRTPHGDRRPGQQGESARARTPPPGRRTTSLQRSAHAIAARRRLRRPPLGLQRPGAASSAAQRDSSSPRDARETPATHRLLPLNTTGPRWEAPRSAPQRHHSLARAECGRRALQATCLAKPR